MTEPHTPTPDSDSSRASHGGISLSYLPRPTTHDTAATEEFARVRGARAQGAPVDATREMPSASTIPAPPAPEASSEPRPYTAARPSAAPPAPDAPSERREIGRASCRERV